MRLYLVGRMVSRKRSLYYFTNKQICRYIILLSVVLQKKD